MTRAFAACPDGAFASRSRACRRPEYVAQPELAPPDAILCDYDLRVQRRACPRNLRGRDPHLPFIIVSNHVDQTAAVVAMQHGASDYLPKRGLGRLPKAIEDAVERAIGRRKEAIAQEALRESEAIRRGILNSLLARVALVDGDGTIVTVNKAWDDFEHMRASVRLRHAVCGTNYPQALKSAGMRRRHAGRWLKACERSSPAKRACSRWNTS